MYAIALGDNTSSTYQTNKTDSTQQTTRFNTTNKSIKNIFIYFITNLKRSNTASFSVNTFTLIFLGLGATVVCRVQPHICSPQDVLANTIGASLIFEILIKTVFKYSLNFSSEKDILF
jgi:hypothetical protein